MLHNYAKRISGKIAISMPIIIVVTSLLASPALAQSSQNIPLSEISELTRGIVFVGTALFGLAILWGGAKIMFSGGDQRFMEEGKNHIKNAVIGLILVLIASAIPSISGGLNLHPLVIIP